MFFSISKKFVFLILIIPFFFVPSKELFFLEKNFNNIHNEASKTNSCLLQEVVQNPTINLFDYASVSGSSQTLEQTLYNFTLFNANENENFQSINFLLKNPDEYENEFTVSWDGNSQQTTIDTLKDDDYVLDLTTLLVGFDFTKNYNESTKSKIKISLSKKSGEIIDISFDYLTTSYQPTFSSLEYKTVDNKIELSTYVTYYQSVIDFFLFENRVDITLDDRVTFTNDQIDDLTSHLVFVVDYGDAFSELKTINFFISATWNDGYNYVDQKENSDLLNIDLQRNSPLPNNLPIIIGSIALVVFSITIVIILVVVFKHSKNKAKK